MASSTGRAATKILLYYISAGSCYSVMNFTRWVQFNRGRGGGPVLFFPRRSDFSRNEMKLQRYSNANENSATLAVLSEWSERKRNEGKDEVAGREKERKREKEKLMSLTLCVLRGIKSTRAMVFRAIPWPLLIPRIREISPATNDSGFRFCF